jgi:DNA-binding PadR family transcriptional regulator
MLVAMSTPPAPRLSDTSFVVLGLVARLGPLTPYDLKRAVASSVGYFWSFPHSQLYAEPARLAKLGLLTEDQEEGGRRRRQYSLTADGRAALRDWLATPEEGHVELRDPGLLQLFFADLADRSEVLALAEAREALHRARLERYEAIAASFDDAARASVGNLTLRRGLYAEQSAVRFWTELREELAAG